MTGLQYQIAAAAETGTYHQAAGTPCEDKVAVFRTEDAVCVVLADGAGSRAHSREGAQCVTEYVAKRLCREFDALWDLAPGPLADTLIDGCIQALDRLEPPVQELASTLLFFAGTGDGRCLSGHLGDGVQILVPRDGPSQVYSPPENGAYLNETYFITGPDAAAHLRLKRTRLEGPGALLLMSDGMAESLYQNATASPAPACRTIARWLEEGEEDVVSEAIAENMRTVFARHSHDDLSLAVIVWQGAD